VPVPRAELAAALDALLGNVFRYTPQGAPLEVAVSRHDGYVAIRVEDGGPGIADPDRALRRGETNHGSTGLGLDIVKRVAYSANGAVNIARGRMGGASIVVLLADAEWTPPAPTRFGFVGRLSRDPAERRRRRAEKGTGDSRLHGPANLS
jgi:signal transduction histidine kinase